MNTTKIFTWLKAIVKKSLTALWTLFASVMKWIDKLFTMTATGSAIYLISVSIVAVYMVFTMIFDRNYEVVPLLFFQVLTVWYVAELFMTNLNKKD